MNERERSVLEELGRVAADVGPALVPAAHTELLESIVGAARDLFDAAACSLALLEENDAELVFHVASGQGAENVVGVRMPSSQGIAGWVVTSGQPIAISDVTRDPRFARDVAEGSGYIPHSILAMPLETDRRMVGVIEVIDRRQGGGEGSRDMELLAIFARQAAVAIENSRIFSDLGRVLFEAAAAAVTDGDLQRTLLRAAEDSPRPRDELAEIAAHFDELGRLGEEERRAATRLLGEFMTYLRRTRRPR